MFTFTFFTFDALASEEFWDDEHDKENAAPIIDLPDLQFESMVTEAKKKDLLWMCDELIIPQSYHSFYRDLCVCSESVQGIAASGDNTMTNTSVSECRCNLQGAVYQHRNHSVRR